jgi:hypothetical protein
MSLTIVPKNPTLYSEPFNTPDTIVHSPFSERPGDEIVTGEQLSESLASKNNNLGYGIGSWIRNAYNKTIGKFFRKGTSIPITNCTQLQEIERDVSADYRLANDIDCSKTANFLPIGDPESPFTGTFDGGYYAITGLTLRTGANYVGLFGVTREASIHDLSLTANIQYSDPVFCVGGLVGNNVNSQITDVFISANISSSDKNGEPFVGCLAGVNSGNIKNVHVNCSLNVLGSDVGGLIGHNKAYVEDSSCKATINTTGSNVGGLIGISELETGQIVKCSFEGDITTNGNVNVGGLIGRLNDGNVTWSFSSSKMLGTNGKRSAGGLVGFLNKAQVFNSYAIIQTIDTIIGEFEAGGLISYSWSGTISDCYAVSRFSSSFQSYAKGLIYSPDSSTSVENCYYDSNVSGQNDTGHGTPKTTTEMYQQYTYTGWAFPVVWTINEGHDYPKLSWQI